MNYVFGYENYGSEIAQSLRTRGKELLVIEQDKNHLELAKSENFNTLFVDFNSDNFHGITFEDNDYFFVATDDDTINIFLTITLRSMNENITIVALSKQHENEHKLKIAGADRVIAVDAMSARMIFNLLEKPAVSEIFHEIVFADNEIRVAEIRVPENSFLSNTHVSDLSIKKDYNLLLFGILDKELNQNFLFTSKGFHQIIDNGDILIVIGYIHEIEIFKKDLYKSTGND